jgi:phage-related protein
MATFPSIAPTFDAQKSSRPRTRVVQFGDGYEQRLSYGLNQNPKEWSLTFMVKNTDADTIEAFLDARAEDGASFDWTPPSSSTAYTWVCREWTRRLIGEDFNEISATFSQVFEP